MTCIFALSDLTRNKDSVDCVEFGSGVGKSKLLGQCPRPGHLTSKSDPSIGT